MQFRIDLVDPSAPIDSMADERARRCPSKRRSRTETPTSTGVRYHASATTRWDNSNGILEVPYEDTIGDLDTMSDFRVLDRALAGG